MVNTVKISSSLAGLVGFRQPFNPDYAVIDADNQLSSSGYYVTDNPYAKIEYIKDSQDYMGISDADFNTFLANMHGASVSNICNQVFSEFDFIDRSLQFKNASNKVETETLPVGFVGDKIKVTREKNTAFTINRVLCDFSGTGTFKLLLWNTAQKAVLQSKDITITTDHQEVELNWTLDNSGNTYKGDYYIGYINTGSLSVAPYKREYENASVMTEPTGLCIERVCVLDHVTETLFDLNTIEGLSQDTGLNFDITVFDDYTDFVINNKQLFARAVCLDMSIKCMQIYISSLRSNRNEILAGDLYQKLMIEIEGTKGQESVVTVKGLRPSLVGEIYQIRAEIQKMQKGFTKQGLIMVNTLR